MARKDLLKSLIEGAQSPAPSETRVDAAKPRYTGGAIGAVSQSIADLKSRAVIDVDPQQIDPGGLEDRLEHVDEDHAALVGSLRDHGQQVPVLLRPHPTEPDRFQVVYGRRRVRALKELGQPVKALVRTLDDQEMILAQGQENSARKDLSFIEKVSFARQMRDLGYARKTICAALHVDKTVISRMMVVADAIDPDLIAVIGAAPSVGRDRWLALAEKLDARGISVEDAILHVNLMAAAERSDKRFEVLFAKLTPAKEEDPDHNRPPDHSLRPLPLHGSEGQKLASAQRLSNKTVLTISRKTDDGFAEWLLQNFSEIHRLYKGGG